MGRERIGLWGTSIFAALSVIGMLIQVYLIGGFIFGQDGWLDTHKDLGMLVHLLYVLTFVSALVGAWPNWRTTTWPFALAVVGSVQAFLAGGGDVGGDNGGLHAFHAALVPIVFVLALVIALRAWKSLQGQPATTAL
jgi:predicted ferric reductase